MPLTQSEARVSGSRCQEAGPLRKLQRRAFPASPSFWGSRHPRAVDTSLQPLLPSPCGPSRISSRMDGSHWLRAQPLRRGLARTAAGGGVQPHPAPPVSCMPPWELGGLWLPGPLGSSCLHTCLLFHLGSGNMRGAFDSTSVSFSLLLKGRWVSALQGSGLPLWVPPGPCWPGCFLLSSGTGQGLAAAGAPGEEGGVGGAGAGRPQALLDSQLPWAAVTVSGFQEARGGGPSECCGGRRGRSCQLGVSLGWRAV